jgi:hypothetical protein
MRTAFADTDNAAVPTSGIAVMAKAPVPGRTKTRLVPPPTFEEAAQCNGIPARCRRQHCCRSARASIADYIADSVWPAGFGAITKASQSRARQFQTKIERLSV